jgi:preprotein translocase subunit YajC
MMSLLALAFYFVMLRPAQRERQERERFLAGLSRDDEVVTTGGIHGRVAVVSEEQVTLLVADKSRIVFDKQAIERRAGDPVSQS